MNQNEIMDKLTKVFRYVFDDESIMIDRDTSREDLEEWDSIANTYLTVEIEEEFGILVGESLSDVQTVDEIYKVVKKVLGE